MFKKLFATQASDRALAWTSLTTENQLTDIIQASYTVPQLIFKHSTRCSISVMALNRLERDWDFDNDALVAHYIDLLQFRGVSAAVAEAFGVLHESPQALLIDGGKCVYFAAHSQIAVVDIAQALKQ